jgi:NAD(P)H-dependent FMN reductase
MRSWTLSRTKALIRQPTDATLACEEFSKSTKGNYMTSDRLKIQIILGSIRENRFGDTVGKWFLGVAGSRENLDAELIDLRDWQLPFFKEPRSPSSGRYAEEARPWAEKIAQGDGYVIISPEYNHGYSAVLKNAMDHIYREWNNKPIGFVSYGGSSGGTRAVEQLRLVAIELQMAPIREAVVIPFARSAFDEDGQPRSTTLNDRANAVLNQMTWWANVLKKARAEG